jgi:hypothetical protein
MTTAIKLDIFLMLAGTSVIAVALTLIVLKKMGHITPAAGLTMDEQVAAKLRQDKPAFARLPIEQQHALVRATRIHPLIWAFVIASLSLFVWTALSVPALLDWINQGSRSAVLVGIVVMACVLGGIALIRRLLIARMLAGLR